MDKNLRDCEMELRDVARRMREADSRGLLPTAPGEWAARVEAAANRIKDHQEAHNKDSVTATA